MSAFLPFEGKTFLVTGASSGIGRATSQLLAMQGAKVLLNGRNEEALAYTAASIPKGQAVCLPHVLRDLDDTAIWVSELVKVHGPLDGLVHSAGIRSALPLRMLKGITVAQEWQLHVQVPMGLLKGFRQRRPKGLPGAVVLVSSVMGLNGAPLQVSYCAAKSAMLGLVRSAALELAPEGIRVNAVAPGCVATEMMASFQEMLTEEQFADIVAQHPLGLGTPEDVAHAAAFLLGDTARWITGTTLVVDGGYTAQ